MIQLREQYWALQGPDDAWVLKSENFRTDFVINMGYLTYPTVGKKKWLELDGAPGLKLPGLDYNERAKGVIKLLPGTWEIVCTSKSVTEEQAISIVQVISNGRISGMPQYRRHDRDPVKDTPARSWTRDARHALETLLTSKECDLNKNWLILKKTT